MKTNALADQVYVWHMHKGPAFTAGGAHQDHLLLQHLGLGQVVHLPGVAEGLADMLARAALREATWPAGSWEGPGWASNSAGPMGCRRRHRILMRGRPEGLCGELKLWPLHSSIRPAGPWAAAGVTVYSCT